MSDLKQTPSQTVGPYFAYGLTARQYHYPQTSVADGTMAGEDVAGERIRVEGRVFDGDGATVPDAMIEIWQADAQGRFAHPADPRNSNTGFSGFGRFGTGTDPQHRFIFDTIKPGAAAEGEAPHLNVIVFMRGLLTHVYTRIYFADEAEANAADPVLSAVPKDRRGTLIAQREGNTYRLDIHMQGDRETVFFEV
ncbi:protocatechuate 3,4-dioxygenase subunit alpha [Thalassobaculum sp. OXR-137]|uniref:protocatechuate 3,4-dioxygenase subunit alpha n=1 Tax=Thalassobaculum sp. OXR-137 TaxID=3100173 RepID=UPI002AC8D678|nr:protocatechuate 3,4-dioxygenase subunit alpha [Thalassobaculum sp. OXR-137]WPZ36496.1 protocatechuate 3,4-dioxygenase subunit alpha [Thalassobaculum sp. OXR-137]